ncbi:hypothetical protein PGTUg99_024730 [Puccinia graminis f. sp. tritici]|uniref:Uncharacterized protein n=1 Tax=Puccinia graminis f. sp. tritici TaxID=56615 RepID=A0A5B0SI78_PUCGR|nr:hypothetical protein PGTUg99_024730 [Puccinia graminis f. sp. tritici]
MNLVINMEQTADQPTRKLVEGFEWKHGSKTVRKRIIQGGLLPAVVESWYPSSAHDSYGVLLEDDVEVSGYYSGWLKFALLEYRYSGRPAGAIYGIYLYQIQAELTAAQAKREFAIPLKPLSRSHSLLDGLKRPPGSRHPARLPSLSSLTTFDLWAEPALSLSFLLLAIIHITIGERLNNISPSRIQDSLRQNIPSTRLKIGELTAQNSLNLSIQTNLTLDLHQLTVTTSKNRLGKTVEEKLLRWLVAQSANATLSSSSPIQIYEADNHGDQEPLLELNLLEPFILPLSYTLPSKHADDHPSPPPTQRTTIALRIHFRAPARLPPLLLTPALDLRVVIKDLDLRLSCSSGHSDLDLH